MAETVSIVTAVYNRADTIRRALDSIRSQSWSNLQHIVIDGASTDGTLEFLKSRRDEIDVLVSEKDNGIYDALNKGFSCATGGILGVLHSDDFFADEDVIEEVATLMNDPQLDGVYGDLEYVSKEDPAHVIRRWRSGCYDVSRLKYGWMPPHPTLFLRRSVIEKWGMFDTNYQIAADYDAILRYLWRGKIKLGYIPSVLVKMRVGGESNRSLFRIVKKSHEDYRALRKNKIGGIGTLIWKNVSKLHQFIK